MGGLQSRPVKVQRQGGGIVSGVHVRSLTWQNGKTIIETDEIEPFEAKAVIAADGVNSEVAEITGARAKFTPEQACTRCKGRSQTA